jgi:hypothetical protein
MNDWTDRRLPEPSLKGYIIAIVGGLALWALALALLPAMPPKAVRIATNVGAVVLLVAGSYGMFLSFVEMPRRGRRSRRAYR